MAKNKTIQVQNLPISVSVDDGNDFICLTDMANAREGAIRAADIIKNWLRNRYTLEFLGTWEQMNNPLLKWSNLITLKCKQGYPFKSDCRKPPNKKTAIK
jgi:hypothetical protein